MCLRGSDSALSITPPAVRHLRRVAVTLVPCLAALWVLVVRPDLAQGQAELVTLVPSPTCSECRIVMTPEIEFSGGGEEFGGVSYPRVLERDSRGRFYLSSDYGAATLQVREPDGSFLGSIGGAGDGPEEFRHVTALVIGEGDTLRVFDMNAGTYSVISPQHEFVRRTRVVAPVSDAIEVEPNHLIIAANFRSPTRYGYALHHVRRGELAGSIGSDETIDSRGRLGRHAATRSLATAGAGQFFAVHWPRYVVDLFSTKGQHLKRFTRDAEWFEVEDETTLRGRMNPLIFDAAVSPDGVLWLLASVRSPRFDEIVEHAGDQPAAGGGTLAMIVSNTGNMDDLNASVIEAVEPVSGTVLATLEFPRLLGGMLGPDLVYEYQLDGAGREKIVVWRLSVAGR